MEKKMRFLEDKFLLKKCPKAKDMFKMFFPTGCYGESNVEIGEQRQVSLPNGKKSPIVKFPMVRTTREKIVQKSHLKNNETFKIIEEPAHFTAFIPVNLKNSILSVNRDSKVVFGAVKFALKEFYQEEMRDEEDLVKKYRSASSSLSISSKSDFGVEKRISELLSRTDAVEIAFNDYPIIVSRFDYQGFKGEKMFEVVGVDFYQFDKTKMSSSMIEEVTKSAVAEKRANFPSKEK